MFDKIRSLIFPPFQLPIKNGKKMRMAKIVDIKGKENTSMYDDYGNEHILPEKATFKINSFRKRKVNIVEIKKDKLITK